MAPYRLPQGPGTDRVTTQEAVAWAKDGTVVELASVRFGASAMRFGSKNYAEGALGPVRGWTVKVESRDGFTLDEESGDHQTEEAARRAANQAVLRHGGLAAAQGRLRRPIGVPARPAK